MKILFCIDTFLAGGKERRMVELLKELRLNSDIEFELVVMDSDIHYKETFNLGINIHYILRRTKKDPSVFFKFYKLCKTYKPDIVHCWDSMTAVYLIPCCRLLNIILVNGMVADAPDKLNIFNKNFFRAKLTFPFSNAVIANSKAGLAAYNAPKNKSYCIHNGFNFNRTNKLVEADILRKQLNIDGKYVIGMVAAFEKRKDYRTLITAAISVVYLQPDAVFLLIGDGELKNEIMQMVPDKLNKNFLFPGNVENVESYINIFDIAVLCTNTLVHKEGISNAILEYMALGKPVIATEGGGTNEIVIDNFTGFAIPPFNANILADKIIHLIKEPELRKTLGCNGLRRVKESFTIEEMYSQYCSLYYQLIKTHYIGIGPNNPSTSSG